MTSPPKSDDPRRVELDPKAIYLALLRIPAADRPGWRWRTSKASLNRLRQIRTAPEAGPLVVAAPLPGAEGPRWWMVGRPVHLDADAGGLWLEPGP